MLEVGDERASGVGVNANSNGPAEIAANRTQMGACEVEHLQPMVAVVSHDDVTRDGMKNNAAGRLEFTGFVSLRAEVATKFAFGGENQHAVFGLVCDVNFISLAVDAQPVGCRQLIRAELILVDAVLVEHLDTTVAPFTDEDVSTDRMHGHTRWEAKLTVPHAVRAKLKNQ